MAASLVDVASWAEGTLCNEDECKIKMSEYLENYQTQHELDDDFAVKAEEELARYLNKEEIFAMETVQRHATSMSPRRFFDKYMAKIPHFGQAALHLASKVCGSGEAERNWKEVKFIYSKARNRLKPEKRAKLITRYNVLSNRLGYLDVDEVDPSKEIAKYGLDEELKDPVSSAPSGLGGGANDSIRRNAFMAYPEEGVFYHHHLLESPKKIIR